jgi:cytochrome c553
MMQTPYIISRLRLMPSLSRPLLLAITLSLCGPAANAQQPPITPSATVDPTLDGAQLFKNTCAVCHGEKGQGKDELKTPSIAHQPAYYVKNQLTSFRQDRRGVSPEDTQGLIMATIAKALKPEQVEAVAKHIETLPLIPPKQITWEGADLKEGQWLFEMRCMECHRFNGSGEIAFGSPPLIGLQGWYLTAQLEKFKTGKRGTVPGDVNGAKMVFTSSFIENDQMLKDIVGYLLTLNPPSQSNPFGD